MSTYTIKIRRDTDANWRTYNPVLALGEFAVVTDLDPVRLKIGNGVNAYTTLPFFTLPAATSSMDGLLAAADKAKLDDYPDYTDLPAAILEEAGKTVGEAVSLTFDLVSNRTQDVYNHTDAPTTPQMVAYQGKGYDRHNLRLVAGTTAVKYVYAEPSVIPANAFAGIDYATAAHIPSWVHEIGEKAFKETTVTKVVCEAVVPPKVNLNTFDDPGSVTVYVPSIALTDYQSDPVWSQFTLGTIESTL